MCIRAHCCMLAFFIIDSFHMKFWMTQKLCGWKSLINMLEYMSLIHFMNKMSGMQRWSPPKYLTSGDYPKRTCNFPRISSVCVNIQSENAWNQPKISKLIGSKIKKKISKSIWSVGIEKAKPLIGTPDKKD